MEVFVLLQSLEDVEASTPSIGAEQGMEKGCSEQKLYVMYSALAEKPWNLILTSCAWSTHLTSLRLPNPQL